MLQAYRQHSAERAALGIPPLPLSAQQVDELIALIKNPPAGEEKVLLDIPNWDFAWQLNYQPVEPIEVKRGDVIGVECTWDRTLRYDENPRYIVFSEGTEDEMCFSTITARPPREP